MSEPIFKKVSGRFIWRSGETTILPTYLILEHSPVSFPDLETAQRIYRLLEAAQRVNGRRLLTERTLNEILKYAADMAGPRCAFEGWIVRSTGDAEGRNWDVNWRGADRRTKSLMYSAVTKLRKTVNLLDF
ncbi:hypothetical protein [Massilia oculi]|uniref:hypothetical protein n=1 Tax=Massilia oculi TaxID=945844 RepID=UPI001AAED598|nr:hypothetical protein [Massilia oculi]